MFNIVFANLIWDILPIELRKPFIYARLVSMMKPLQEAYDKLMYLLRWNSQTASFETYLNDQYSLPYFFSNRATLIASGSIIWIETVQSFDPITLYNKIETRPPVVICNKWKSATVFNAGEFCSRLGKIYKSVGSGNTGNDPAVSSAWAFVSDGIVLLNKNDPSNTIDFIIWVPAALVYDASQLNAQINQYRISGKNYQIQTY